MKLLDRMTWVCLAAVAASCATPTQPQEPPPPPTYLERVADRVLEQMESPVHRLRYNPTPCGCPPFEMFVGDHWHRVMLEAEEDDEAMVALMAAVTLEREGRRYGEHPVQGSLSRSVNTCARGAALVNLELSEYGDLDLGPPESEASPGDALPVDSEAP